MKEMKDNHKVHSNHQKGIERVKQRKGDMEKGQGGKMGDKGASEKHWKRPNSAATPRHA
jgi:hypothetical protein